MNAVAHYTSAFAGSESGLPGSAVPWLVEQRRAAIASLSSSGFPTTRDEAWRYTDVAQLLSVPFTATKSSAELVNAMKQSYSQVTDGAMSLDIGAKVNMGEMKW